MEEKYRKRMTEALGYKRQDKSLQTWRKVKSVRSILKNYLIMVICRYLPDIELKNRIYRKTGMRIGRNVSIYASNLDILFPELIEIGDNTVIGNTTAILTHEFLSHGSRKGRVKIGKDVTIGIMTIILPGVEIGDGAVVSAYSLVNKSVEPGAFVGGVPIKRIR
ncbi:MAG: acyltransferase [Candidatus Aenigmarchaeota archaeon]|nr:acyltransferase [Candidatus Aenigmarchaeota archaeon]